MSRCCMKEGVRGFQGVFLTPRARDIRKGMHIGSSQYHPLHPPNPLLWASVSKWRRQDRGPAPHPGLRSQPQRGEPPIARNLPAKGRKAASIVKRPFCPPALRPRVPHGC